MTRIYVFMLAFGSMFLATLAERYWGTTRYTLNGLKYAVPHRYEFMPYYRTHIDLASGFVAEPNQQISVIIPAHEIVRTIPGYRGVVHGYSSDISADVLVNIRGWRDTNEFWERYAAVWKRVGELERAGNPLEPDLVTGFERINQMPRDWGSLGEGNSIFFLVPKKGQQIPKYSLPATCVASQDNYDHEQYSCTYTISAGSLIFDFSLRQENLNYANRIPNYVLRRLLAWRS